MTVYSLTDSSKTDLLSYLDKFYLYIDILSGIYWYWRSKIDFWWKKSVYDHLMSKLRKSICHSPVVFRWLIKFLTKFNLLSIRQFRLQSSKNTQDTIFAFLETAATVFCDLSKAFDSVNHARSKFVDLEILYYPGLGHTNMNIPVCVI